MSHCYVYLKVLGEAFDFDRFNSELNTDLKGIVKETKNTKEKYWESNRIEVLKGYPEDHLYDLLKLYAGQLTSINCEKRVFAEIVMYCSDLDSLRGVYLPTELIKLLSELGAEVDIDIVREL